MNRSIESGASLPDPEVGPTVDDLIERVGGACVVSCEFSEFLLGGVTLEADAAAGGKAGGSLGGAGEKFFDGPGVAACFEGEFYFGMSAMDAGDHGPLEVATGLVTHEEGSVDGFGKSAFASVGSVLGNEYF